MHKFQKQPIVIQAGVSAAMIFFGLTVMDGWLMQIIICAFAVLLAKDALTMHRSEFVVGKDSFQYMVGDKIKWEIKWADLDMVTRTKKNHKWVVISDGQEFKVLKTTITGFEDMIRQIVERGAVNPQLKLHESIQDYMDVKLSLDDHGRIKKKSREALLEGTESDPVE